MQPEIRWVVNAMPKSEDKNLPIMHLGCGANKLDAVALGTQEVEGPLVTSLKAPIGLVGEKEPHVLPHGEDLGVALGKNSHAREVQVSSVSEQRLIVICNLGQRVRMRTQEFFASPSTITRQAPQSLVAQPHLVPVRSSISRST